MPLKADLDGNPDFQSSGCNGEDRGSRGCIGSGNAEFPEYPEYLRCAWCNRGLCKYVAIEVDSEGPVCRYCEEDGDGRGLYLYGSKEEGIIYSRLEDYEAWEKEIE